MIYHRFITASQNRGSCLHWFKLVIANLCRKTNISCRIRSPASDLPVRLRVMLLYHTTRQIYLPIHWNVRMV